MVKKSHQAILDNETSLSDNYIDEYLEKQKGVSEAQKDILKRLFKGDDFRNYAKNSKSHLSKLVKTVKKQVKEYYNKKGDREDRRGVEHKPPKKGTTKKEMKKKMEIEKPKEKPIVITKGKKQNLPKAPKEVRVKITKEKRKEYRKVYNQRPEVKEANRIRKRQASKK
jgi:hypothetical protein